ncbi:TetR/AcrR family transcriptional regulator [Psychrobacter phenylpyruvicus]|uniref:Bacterial regulatory proteins, tetR family n=1 Tax=Psychrobacter phenylpyruvicus TaxID=29432 RepID=A0A379LID7_9GAMM|nr:TetR/AcrR family transcriptional regulator [Psychrobacter phenylpyruvicus]SUD90360.1 Bacterial regulatory proteins, tetR family [Psychrobacter phenylpyruvicus]
MEKGCNDLINDVLVDSELAKKIVPNKFKHTSKQGRIRRQKLLMAAKKLTEKHDIQDITLVDICEEANIPRASAYHFFPNVEAIFLALRFLSYMDTYQILEKIEVCNFQRWQDYVTEIIMQSASLFNDDVTKNKLMYGLNTPDLDNGDYDVEADLNLVGMVVNKLSSHYNMESFKDIEDKFLVTYYMIHSIFSLSFKQHDEITEDMDQEAVTAALAYLRCYLPEELPFK